MVIPYHPMNSKRVMAAPPSALIPFNRHLHFHEVCMEHIYQTCWIVRVLVVWKGQIRQNGMGNRYLQCILLDEAGSKMEAIAYNRQADHFDDVLWQHIAYNLTGIGFEPTEMPLRHFWYLDLEFVVTLLPHTKLSTMPALIEFPLFPRRFLDFNTIYSLRDKTITDVVGVLAFVGDIEYEKTYCRNILSREIALMNIRHQLIFVHVLDAHVAHQITRWRIAEEDFEQLAVTHVKKDRRMGCLTTTAQSRFSFSPDTNESSDLEDLWVGNLSEPEGIRAYVNGAVQLRNQAFN